MGCASGSVQGYFRPSKGMVSPEDRWDGTESFPSLLYTIVTAACPPNDSFGPKSTFQLFRNVTNASSHNCHQQLNGQIWIHTVVYAECRFHTTF